MSETPKPPEALRRRGLKRITDNVPPDYGVRLPAGAFYTWFGDPLMAQLRERGGRPHPTDKETQGDG